MHVAALDLALVSNSKLLLPTTFNKTAKPSDFFSEPVSYYDAAASGVRLSVCPSVRLSVRPSVRVNPENEFWLWENEFNDLT